MPEIKIWYSFNGDVRTFSETHVLPPEVNASRYFDTLNNEWNDQRPTGQDKRNIVNIEIINFWKHLHSYSRVAGFEYYQCNLCGCTATHSKGRFNRLQGWEEEEYEYCRERPPKLPKVKVSNLVISEIEIPEPEPEPDPNARKKLKKFKL